MLIDIKMNKICSRSRSQWLFENLSRPGHLSPFLQNGKVYLDKICMEYKKDLDVNWYQNEKKTNC